MNASRALLKLWVAGAAALCVWSNVPAATAQPLYPLPDPDGFYSAPADINAHPNGQVLRSRLIPQVGYPGATVWQLLFRSQNSAGNPIAGVTTLLLPPGGGANRPLVSYQPFVNSLGTQCAPSHTLFNGSLQEASALNMLLGRGWAVNVPDHLGPNEAYGAAMLGGRLVLDSLRAARSFGPAVLGGSPIALAGYSGGGMATGFAAALAPSYAPELPIIGAAQGGVPVDLGQVAVDAGLRPNPLFGLGLAAGMGMEREYPTRMHLTDNLNDRGHALEHQIANSCVNDIISAGSGLSLPALRKPGVFDADPSTKDVIHENSLAMFPGVPRIPIYEWHGGSDLVSVPLAQRMAGRYCASGVHMDFVVMPGLDHGGAMVLGIIPAFSFLADLFAGRPAPSNC